MPGPFAKLMTASLTRLRYAVQTQDDEGFPVEQTPAEIAFKGSWQPADLSMTVDDPGYGGQERRRVWSFVELVSVREEGAGYPPDEVRDEDTGLAWKVWWAHPWPALGPIRRHWEAEVYLLQPLRPQVGVPPDP